MAEERPTEVAASDHDKILAANTIWDFTERSEHLWKNEPPEGSVVLAFGLTGTAYQRWYSDGMWHGSNGKVTNWHDLIIETIGNILIATWVIEKKESK